MCFNNLLCSLAFDFGKSLVEINNLWLLDRFSSHVLTTRDYHIRIESVNLFATLLKNLRKFELRDYIITHCDLVYVMMQLLSAPDSVPR